MLAPFPKDKRHGKWRAAVLQPPVPRPAPPHAPSSGLRAARTLPHPRPSSGSHAAMLRAPRHPTHPHPTRHACGLPPFVPAGWTSHKGALARVVTVQNATRPGSRGLLQTVIKRYQVGC